MKSLNEFVALFAEQFDETDASEIQASTVFHDLDEWSSLIGLSVIAMVDEEFEVALKGDDVKTSVTVEDLYNKVIAKLEWHFLNLKTLGSPASVQMIIKKFSAT